MAQLEHQSSTEATESSEVAFRQASIKMNVMVFKRSALESRKKTKSVLRPKVRPPIKELLQATPSPRSPTEKLLFEMFEGHSARFLAML
ncbi:MAG: cilia- and flagella-associated protein 54, partial [Proteobacteria bacterium]|nr:cilia- and flagella-associated protein 54 [Pseudomonadota bacterium]